MTPMLAIPERFRCVECGKAFGAEDFACYEGDVANGPAYWSDRGVLCSPGCSLAHHMKRMEEGSVASTPAPDPLAPFKSRR